jgi:adenylate cyclase
MSGDATQEYVSDGITEDIITELSRFPELFVIARNSSFRYKGKAADIRQIGQELGVRYILEGSVRRSDNRVRIAAQLIDAATGAHRWAERYDHEFTDVLAVQADVARAVAAVLAAHVRNAEAERAALKPPATWQAYDCYLRAAHALNSFWTTYKVDEFWEARRLAERSVQVDPNYARGYALLSSTYVVAWLNSFGIDPSDNSPLERGLELAARAAQLDATLPQARAQLGNALSWQGQHEAGLAEFEKAAELNPNFADWRHAIALILAGHHTTALDIARDYFRKDPFAPGSAYLWVGTAHYLLKEYPQALAVFRQCVSRMPNARFIHSWLAATYAQLDDLTHAHFHAAEVLRLEPRFTIRKMGKTFLALKSAVDAQHVLEGLKKAGLPEE